MFFRTSPRAIISIKLFALAPLPRYLILLELRRKREYRYRQIIRRYTVDYPYLYEPDILDLD